MPNVVASLYHDLTSETTNPPAWALSGRVWITLFMAILVPLSFLRNLNSLRHTSYISLFAAGGFRLSTPRPQSLNWCIRIPRRDCDHLLFPTPEGHAGTGGGSSRSLHAQLHHDVPGPGVCFHVRPECETCRFMAPV
jgi:hypothetical protein